MQELSAPTAVVKRDGRWKTLEVRELVPGDVIELKGGDVIPADGEVSPSPCSAFLAHAFLFLRILHIYSH
jgi:magnesium-transporting ATPase (P-type)